MKGKLYIDGGARPTNPGPAGFAAILHVNGEQHRIARYIGWTTNNVAEYTALVVGVKMAIDHGVTKLLIITDSQMMIGHLTKGWQRKDEKLRMLIRDAEDLLHKNYVIPFDGEKRWDIKWVKRTHNQLADAACTKAILGRPPNPWAERLSTRIATSASRARVRVRR